MLTTAQIKRVHLPPEKIPDSWYGGVPLTAEVAPLVVDLKGFKPYILMLTDLQVVANPNVELRAKFDGYPINQNTAAFLSAFPGAWRLLAKDTLTLNFYGVAAVANYTAHYGVWVQKPTVAHKILYGLSLDPSETALATKLGIWDSVQKGVLPVPISRQIEWEYTVVEEETHSVSVNIAIPNVVYPMESLTARKPLKDEIIALTRVAAAPGGAANIVRLVIDRDDDAGYADLQTFPLSLVPGGEISCFIPALKEIKLSCQAAVAPGAHLFRYSFQRIKLNNILRARFVLASRDELPGDTYDKVLAGVL